MITYGLLFVFALSLHVSTAARYGLFDGKSTNVEKYPQHVKVFGSYMSSWECEGVIIGDQWILTRAWCLRSSTYPASAFTVRVAVGSSSTNSQEYKVNQVFTHPKYQTQGIIQNYDYALLRLSGTLEWSDAVQKAELPKKRLSVGATVSVATYNNAGSQAGLEDGEMSLIANKKCAPFWTTYTQRLTSQLACLYNKGKTTYCTNSYGSPVVVDNTIYFLEVRSDPKGCTADSIPTIMADIVPAVSWIHTITGIKP